ncbi:insulinase family protein [Maribellus luteus]|uniref:Insulinase family protein n=1 Tax=Maribellus luteus TaxID=2305463 RepID=A0A399T3N7_9BACT|nr:insulinase family protein [Maribellus luteus]RIJ50478.1 insulinase family protein [Maribellus luteus]
MRNFILLFIILLVSSVFSSAQELKPPKKLVKGTLDNGLTYYIYPNKKPEGEAVYRLFIKSGSLFETEEQRGLAHFLEHMAFNGTRHFPGNSLTAFLESKGAKFGADLNAHTSMNETVYKLQLPSTDPAFVDSTIMILADWAGGLLLDSTEVEDERGVILSEWLLKVGPKYEAQNAFLLELLNNSRYSRRLTIGDTAVIKNFPLEDLQAYYQKWYDPSIMAVAVAGDVDVAKVKKSIKKYFSHMSSSLNGVLPKHPISDYDKVEVKTVSHESLDGVELNVIQLLEQPVAVTTEKEYPAYLQRTLLNQLIKARFAERSFSNPAYKDASYSYSSFLNTKGALLGSVELTPTKIKAGIIDFASASEQMFRYGFTSGEIRKAKTIYINGLKRKAESKKPSLSSALVNEIYSEFYVGNKIVSAKDEYKLALKYIDAIDSLKLCNQLQHLHTPHKTHYLITTFDKAKDEIPSETALISIFDSIRTSNIQPYQYAVEMPESLLPKEPLAGKIVKTKRLEEIDADQLTLSNGAVVTFKSSSLSPDDILLSAFRKGGLYALDSVDYVSGLYTGSIVGLSGAGDFSRQELSRYLAGSSVSSRFIIEKSRVGIGAKSNIEDLELLFQLLYLKWTSPRIDTAIFEQTKSKAIETYQTRNETPTTRFYEDFSLLLNGDNYTTRTVTDTRLEKELQLNRILPLFQSHYNSAQGFHFVFVGDCSLKEIKPYIEKYIGSLPGDTPENNGYQYTYSETVANDTSLIQNVGDNAKSTVSLMFQSNKKIDDYNHTQLLNDMTEEIVRARLLEVLREKMGMIYSVGVQMSQTKHPSDLRRTSIRFSCKPEDVDTLIATTMEQLKLLAQNPENLGLKLADVKQNQLKDWQLDKQRITYWSGGIRNKLFNNENSWEYLTGFDRIIEQITVDSISENIQRELLQVPMVKAVLNPAPTPDNNEMQSIN